MTQKRGGGPQKGPGGGQRRDARAPEDGAQASAVVAALARAPAQRSLRRRVEARRHALARGLQAERDRRQVSSAEAGRRRRRPRRRAGRLEPDRGRARAVDRRQGPGGGDRLSRRWSRCPASRSMRARFHRPRVPRTQLKALLRDGRADVVLSDMAAPTTGHTRTDHLRIMGLAEAAAYFACDVLRAGRDVHRQGAAGRHRARAARSA